MSSKDTWRMVTTEAGDGPVVIYRIRNQPPPFARRENFPHTFVIQWEYASPNEHGLPYDDVETRMLELENLLQPAFEDARQAFLFVVVVGNGVRESQWYARDLRRTMELVNATLGELEPFPVKLFFKDDAEWKTYARFLKDSGGEV